VSTGPDRPASIITFKVDSDGNVQGSASNLVADLGVAVLEMGEMTWSNEGFGASDAKFTLNGPLGLSGNVDQVNIGADGLSFGNADMSVQLPEFAFGDYSFANNMVKLSAVNAAEGMQYIATIDTMMNAGAGQSNPLRITLAPGVSPDQMAAMGQVNGLALNIGGVTVVLEGLMPQ